MKRVLTTVLNWVLILTMPVWGGAFLLVLSVCVGNGEHVRVLSTGKESLLTAVIAAFKEIAGR